MGLVILPLKLSVLTSRNFELIKNVLKMEWELYKHLFVITLHILKLDSLYLEEWEMSKSHQLSILPK